MISGKRMRLSLLFAAVVFFIITLTMTLVFLGMLVLQRLGVIMKPTLHWLPFLLFSIVSILVGTGIGLLFSNVSLKPIRTIMAATDKIAKGDYTVRVDLKSPEDFRQLSDSFNRMAEELNSVEILRNDFVNNFSHEFKTPIVSIRGFARMLQRSDLSDQERKEYLEIIIDETERLSELSTNTLMLSKLEQLSILTDRARFNVTEQLRTCLAILDSKWSGKEVRLAFDAPEVFITGNQDLMKQVWINLLDNAYKYVPEHGKIVIGIQANEADCQIRITNEVAEGRHIQLPRIFDKYYQGDTSHQGNGNGLGLPIARRIIQLHHGVITAELVDSGDFALMVRLPRNFS